MPGATPELQLFVREALARGHSREAVAAALADAGWTPEQVRDALEAYAEVDFPLPVPRPRPYLSAREAFLYLLLFTMLYLSAFQLGSLLFDLIDHALPDAAEGLRGADGRGGSMRWGVATLLVGFPVFLFVAGRLGGELARQPVKRGSMVRRWLTWLTLFAAATVLVGDLIALVYQLLGGALTLRFGLKVLVVGLIAGTVFGYYLHDLRADDGEAAPIAAPRVGRRLAIAASVVVLATLAAAVLVMDSPGTRRAANLDARRIMDLQRIEQAVQLYAREHDGALPPDLAALATMPGVRLAVADPADGRPYRYEPAGPRGFRLCAAFATDTAVAGDSWGGLEWSHGQGRQCFERVLPDKVGETR